ncbi:ATP-dependent permease [Cladophialophora chaetospira]|uniref:ATP-dependent permease n=1 Tax=Cladophialophora chaetospira TaxID=386627 RepID=A0AA38X3S7_9EURO|nr:ATP-dependent permease [Cladophialophora chaetospira]
MNADGERDDPIDGTEKKQGHGFLDGWKSLFYFTSTSHLPVLLPAILSSVAAGGLQPAMALFIGRFFDTISDFASGNIDGTAFMNKSLSTFRALFVIAAATFLFKGLLFILWLVFGEMQARTVRELLFESLLERDVEWYETRTSGVGTLLTRLQRQIKDLQLGTSQPLGLVVVCLIQALAALGLALHTNWKLALVILSAIPVIAVGATLISRGLQTNIDRQAEQLMIATKIASNCVKNVVTVKCFSTQEEEATSYATSTRRAAVFAIKQAFSNALQLGFVRFGTTAMFVQGKCVSDTLGKNSLRVAGFWYGGTQVHLGQTTAGKVVTTFWASLIATKAFEDMLPHGIIIQKSQVSAIALKAVIDKISFAYPSTPGRHALQDCSFHFPAGETTFIVGESGSGKSTLSSLLLRFYLPQSGAIFIDDNAIEDIDTNWLKNNITLVQQNCILFSETIFRNIALGRRDYDRVTDAQIDECVHMAALDSTIASLPAGTQTKVGTGGSSLSGGQKQRIALARARLRNTPILILDESTSALDNTSKALVINSVRGWRHRKTTLIITHDLTQIQDEDFVYVLERGRIVQEGRRRTLAHIGRTTLDRRVKVQSLQLVGPKQASKRSSGKRRMDPAKALSSHPVRKDSFDFLTAEKSDETPVETVQYDPQSARSRGRLKAGISMSSTTAIKMLKRQSMARAKIMYSLHQSQLQVKKPATDAPGRIKIKNSVIAAARNSVFIPRMPRTPIWRDKPLPVPFPLTQYEELRDDENFEAPIEDPSTGHAHLTSSILAVLRTVWPTLDRVNRRKLLLGFLATLMHAGAPPTFSYAIVQVFDSYYLPTGYQKKALTWSMVIIGVGVGDGVACFFMQYLLSTAGQAWVDTLRDHAFRRILSQPKGWFDEERNSPTTLVSSLDKTAEEVKDLIERFAAQLLVVIVMMLVAILWAMVTCWKITLVSLAASPVLYLLARCFEVVSARWESRTNAAGETVNEAFVETFTDIKTIRSLTLEPYFHMKYRDATRGAFSVGLRRALYTGFFFGLSDSAIAFFIPMIFWYGATLARDNEWPVRSILTVYGMLLFCTANANAIIAYIPQSSSAADTASRLIRLAHMPVNSHEEIGTVCLDREDPATLSGPVHFINMTFHYPTRPEVPALRRLNITIPAGQTTAIVGTSGSGKSTITALLLVLYPPGGNHTAASNMFDDDPPSLTLSGRDIRTLDLKTLRSLITMVPQSPVLLPTTVRENITYGLDPNSPLASASAIESAARAAGIHDFMVSLPQGYATKIGDGGLGVSGGQAQRIVIARALIRDPKMLILDEATSALDYESAEVIRRSLLRLMNENKKKGKVLTVIVVTHAREMMEWADHVIVMEDGTAVEQGGFQELMGLEGRGKLWKMLNAGGGQGSTRD